MKRNIFLLGKDANTVPVANIRIEGLFCEHKNPFTLHVYTFLRQDVQLLLHIKSS